MVAGYLRLVRPLGRGGMGAVWVAEHLRLGGNVAVKFLAGELANDAGTRARFEQEARVSAQVRSPHVVQVMDFGVTEGEAPQPFIVMELLDGEDLSKLLEREGPLPPAKTEVLLGQLCQALSHAHAMGVVHRDIKPENVFLVRGTRPFVKLLDFGIALGNNPNSIQRLTQTGLIIGTAHYMSPEQLFTAREVDHRTDLWAIGILAYQMLTTRLPFNGDTFGALCVQVQTGQFTPPTELASVPQGMNAWFQRALATDREKRFQSAEELFQAFQTAIASIGGGSAQFERTFSHDAESHQHGYGAAYASRTGSALSVTSNHGKSKVPVWILAAAGIFGLGVLLTVGAIVFKVGPFVAAAPEASVNSEHASAAEALLHSEKPTAKVDTAEAKPTPQAAQPSATVNQPNVAPASPISSPALPTKPAAPKLKPAPPKVAEPPPKPAAPAPLKPAKPAPDKPKDRGF